MRTAAPGDFKVDVDDVGSFTFGRRSPRDVFRIRGEYARLTGGNITEDGSFGDFPALVFVTIKQLMVSGPDAFNLDNIDPLVDESWESRLIRVFTALRAKELSFRPGSGEGSETPSA